MGEDPEPEVVEPTVSTSVAQLTDGGSGPKGQWPFALVLTGLAVSLVIVAMDHFRRGSVLFAALVVLAFFLRLLLRTSDAGWLAVRSRGVDLACMGALGLGLAVFAFWVPPPS